MRRATLHRLFDVGVVLKLLDGVLEIAGAALVLAVSPARMNHLARLLTQHELSEDPHDFIANHLLTFVHHLEGSGKLFAAAYLAVHGAVKVGLAIAVLRRALWAYPTMLGVLGLFAAYQVYRIAIATSLGMILLTVLDVAVIWLVWREWRAVRAARGPDEVAPG